MTRLLFALLLAAVPALSAGQSDERVVKPEIRDGQIQLTAISARRPRAARARSRVGTFVG